MTTDTEADKLLRDIVDRFDKYGVHLIADHESSIKAARAYLARKDEDADVATVRRALTAGYVVDDWTKITAALDRIAARLKTMPVADDGIKFAQESIAQSLYKKAEEKWTEARHARLTESKNIYTVGDGLQLEGNILNTVSQEIRLGRHVK